MGSAFHLLYARYSGTLTLTAPTAIRLWETFTLTLKAPITTAADDIHKYFFHCFSEKIRLDVLCESSAWQGIHFKHQVLFS